MREIIGDIHIIGDTQGNKQFLLSSIGIEESIGFMKIFNFRFLKDLYVLGCPEHDLTISGKCLSVCV